MRPAMPLPHLNTGILAADRENAAHLIDIPAGIEHVTAPVMHGLRKQGYAWLCSVNTLRDGAFALTRSGFKSSSVLAYRGHSSGV